MTSGSTQRRRSASEGDDKERESQPRETARNQLFRTHQILATRTKTFTEDVSTILERVRNEEGSARTWLDVEVRNCQRQLERIEEQESNAWILIAEVEGKPAQSRRIERWRDWHSRQAEKLRSAKALSWKPAHRDASGYEERHAGRWHRSAGHVEKVKLPTFSGRQEDFAEFRGQFRELCQGERYTPILEMAQLRLKLPKEALTTITGLQCPEEAWKRLEELYGNRVLSILSAIKHLQDFKPKPAAAHEQVIETAMAVQKCMTELKNIKAVHELLGDCESVACIILALPPTVRDKWYDKEVPEDTYKMGEMLIQWLETQRLNAIRVRMDVMAAKLRNPAQPPGPSKVSSESTDKGLLSSSLHTQGIPKQPATSAGQGVVTQESSSGDQGKESQPARIDVKTMQDAVQIAERRKANLEKRKIAKCPLCDMEHTYERVWPNTQPPVKARLISTHLTTCARFLAMPPDEKMAAVLGNAGCLTCAAWDHTVHKFPGGKPPKDPKCSVKVGGSPCGGVHGRWYHDDGKGGSAHSVVVAASIQGPGLYEVYLAPVHSAEEGQEVSPGMIMIDPGSDTNFVRHDFARQLGLTGESCQFRLKVVDREARPIQTTRYHFKIEDGQGVRHDVSALGLETITELPPDPDLTPIRDLVQGYPDAILHRPQGQVDILLGLRNSALHGSTVKEWGNLRLLKSPLGCGWSLHGSHPDLKYPSPCLQPSLSATAYMMSLAEESSHEMLQVFHVRIAPEFHELDELGTTPPPVCLKCKGCRECTFRRRRLTPEEQEVVSRVEREMKVDTITGTITASYPWKKCVRRMVENRKQAQRVQESMEQHMLEAGTHSGYVAEMQKSIREGKVRKITPQEMESWHGPYSLYYYIRGR